MDAIVTHFLQMGYIVEFIKYIAKRSQVVGHQLIWNMKTNMYMDEDMQQKDSKQILKLYSVYHILSKIMIDCGLQNL